MYSEYLPQRNGSTEHKEIYFQEFKKSLKDAERNKPIGYDELSSNVVIDVSDSMKHFKASLEEDVFPDKLKIAKVIPVFKKGDKENVKN